MLFSKRYSDLLSQKDADKQEDFLARLLLQRKKILLALCGLSVNLKRLGQADTTKKQ